MKKILIPFWIPQEVVEHVDDQFELIYPTEKDAAMDIEEVKKKYPQ